MAMSLPNFRQRTGVANGRAWWAMGILPGAICFYVSLTKRNTEKFASHIDVSIEGWDDKVDLCLSQAIGGGANRQGGYLQKRRYRHWNFTYYLPVKIMVFGSGR